MSAHPRWRVAHWRPYAPRVSWDDTAQTLREASAIAIRASNYRGFSAVYREDTDGELVAKEAWQGGDPVPLTALDQMITDHWATEESHARRP